MGKLQEGKGKNVTTSVPKGSQELVCLPKCDLKPFIRCSWIKTIFMYFSKLTVNALCDCSPISHSWYTYVRLDTIKPSHLWPPNTTTIGLGNKTHKFLSQFFFSLFQFINNIFMNQSNTNTLFFLSYHIQCFYNLCIFSYGVKPYFIIHFIFK